MTATIEMALDAKTIGKRLLARRKRLNFTQIDVATLSGYAQSSIGAWERGQYTPDAIAIAVLARVFKCSTDDLISDDPSPFDPPADAA